MGLTFAIVGCGRIARRHAECQQRFGKLISVCDIVKNKATEISRTYNAEAYDNLDDLLQSGKKPDLIAICTPNGLHAVQSILAMEAGIHVLCEKPMAIKSVDCRDMINASERTGKYLFVVKQNRFNPPLVELKKIIEEGRLGIIYSLQLNCFWNRDADYYNDSWRGTKSLDGGTLFTQFSHFIDLLYWLFGEVQDIKAILTNYAHKSIIEFEDTGMVLLKFQNGITGTLNYTVNSYGKNMEGSITVFGKKGTVKVGGQYLNKIEYQDIENYNIENLDVGNAANEYGSYTGSMSNHEKVYENIVHFLEGREPLYVNSEDGMKTVGIIERIYQSTDKIY